MQEVMVEVAGWLALLLSPRHCQSAGPHGPAEDSRLSPARGMPRLRCPLIATRAPPQLLSSSSSASPFAPSFPSFLLLLLLLLLAVSPRVRSLGSRRRQGSPSPPPPTPRSNCRRRRCRRSARGRRRRRAPTADTASPGPRGRIAWAGPPENHSHLQSPAKLPPSSSWRNTFLGGSAGFCVISSRAEISPSWRSGTGLGPGGGGGRGRTGAGGGGAAVPAGPAWASGLWRLLLPFVPYIHLSAFSCS